eukprot:13266729-Alexandrium_andersonii.AAC.1
MHGARKRDGLSTPQASHSSGHRRGQGACVAAEPLEDEPPCSASGRGQGPWTAGADSPAGE